MSTYRVRGRCRPRQLFHWSLRRNRENILKHGLKPGSWSVARDWKPPHICLADTPAMAWCLCLHFRRGQIADLYEVWVNGIELWRRRDFGREYRIRVPVFRSRLRWIAARRVPERIR